MGKYATMQVFPRGFREDADIDVDGFAVAGCRERAEAEGYHPIGEPRIDWYEITQHEVAAEPAPAFFAGDWRVRVVIEVTEDAELRKAVHPA